MIELDRDSAALAYAVGGLPVVLLNWPTATGCSCGNPACGKSVGKHPLAAAMPHGKDDATTDIEVLTRLLDRFPLANIAVRPQTGMAVIDVDPRNGGDRTLTELQSKNEPLPVTLAALTGSGGLHYWFTVPKVSVGRVGDGLDVKTSGGYLVAPPSRHACGGVYRWLNDAPIAPAPRWLRTLLDPPRPRAPRTFGPPRPGAEEGLVRTVAEAATGKRNTLLWWATKKAYEKGSSSQLLDRIRDAAIGNGLTTHAVDATMRSAERWVSEGRGAK